MCTAESPHLQISTSNSRKHVTMPKGSNFTKFSKGYKSVILEYFLIGRIQTALIKLLSPREKHLEVIKDCL